MGVADAGLVHAMRFSVVIFRMKLADAVKILLTSSTISPSQSHSHQHPIMVIISNINTAMLNFSHNFFNIVFIVIVIFVGFCQNLQNASLILIFQRSWFAC